MSCTAASEVAYNWLSKSSFSLNLEPKRKFIGFELCLRGGGAGGASVGLDNCDNLRGGLQRLLLRCSVNEESGLDLDVFPLITDEPLIP